jgi:hypothetical protein
MMAGLSVSDSSASMTSLKPVPILEMVWYCSSSSLYTASRYAPYTPFRLPLHIGATWPSLLAADARSCLSALREERVPSRTL